MCVGVCVYTRYHDSNNVQWRSIVVVRCGQYSNQMHNIRLFIRTRRQWCGSGHGCDGRHKKTVERKRPGSRRNWHARPGPRGFSDLPLSEAAIRDVFQPFFAGGSKKSACLYGTETSRVSFISRLCPHVTFSNYFNAPLVLEENGVLTLNRLVADTSSCGIKCFLRLFFLKKTV